MAAAAAAGLLWLLDALRKFFYLMTPAELALDDSDRMPQWILLHGVPIFFLLIVAEAVATRKRGAYRLHELLTCVSLGSLQYVGQQTFGFLAEMLGLSAEVSAYRWVWEHCRLFEIDSKSNVMLCYVCLLLGKDLGYYASHRAMHEFHLLWVGHSVHHSGEDYHLGTGLRQGIGQAFGWPFYLPLALLGFHPHAFAAHAQLNTLYMFWIHTELVGRLPLGLEYVFNSPMAHRMHHRPPGNCNYAGMLIVWDRLFGTYAAETVRKDFYGLAGQPPTFDPLTLNLQHVQRMARAGPGGLRRLLFGRRVPARWRCSPRALFAPIPAMSADERAHGPQRPKWDGDPAAPRASAALNAWLVFALAACVVCSTRLLLTARSMPPAKAVLAGVTAAATFASIGQVCDRRHPRAQTALGVSAPALAALCACVW